MSVPALRLAAVVAAALALSSCKDSGSGGGGFDQPIANAGPDRVAWKGSVVVLDGGGSVTRTGEALSFAWQQTAGPAVVLVNERTAFPRFVAPRAAGALRFQLVVTDSRASSAPDEVVVTVQNRAPYADAGPDAVAQVGSVVALDAGASFDPDGDPLTATWYQRSGPAVSLDVQPGGVATFLAPATPAILDFGLVVSDGEAVSGENRVRVQVVDASANWPPLAHAGPDLDLPRRSVVVLYGSAEDREHDPLTYTWVQTAGPSVALLGANALTASFVAPAEDADLEFELVVADAFSTGADRVVVHIRNQPPTIALLTLSPSAPGTLEPLVATATVTDPDGDAVTLSWTWLRDGVPVDGATGSTLDPSFTARGEVWTVRLTASDGSRAAAAERSVTIVDTPPVLTVSTPATVEWGTPTTFPVTASDPDGDPVGDAIVLLYGPAGMTVSAGQVSWTPTLPMFDRALDVSFAVGVAGIPALKQEGTIRVLDADRAYPLRRSGIEIPAWQNGLAVIDADGDGTQELIVAGRTGVYELARTPGGGYGQRWMYPFVAGVTTTTAVVAADVSGDGKPEIFVSSASDFGGMNGAVLELDGADRREVARTALYCLDLELADLDGDGALELACLRGTSSYGSTQRLVVLDAATLATEWEGADLALGSSIAIGNVDADPGLEIVAAGGYVFEGATGANSWSYGGGFGQAVDTGDLDGDGVEEIVGMDGWNRFRGFSAVLKAPIWERATSDNDALLVADVNADGTPEIVVGDGQWGNVTAYRYQPATNDLAVVFQLNSQDHGVTSIAAADLDGDGALELAWGTGASSSGEDMFVVASVSPAAVEWKNTNPSQLDGPFSGAKAARTSAGAPPALLFQVSTTNSGYDGSRLVRLDPTTGAVDTSAEIGTNWSENSALAVADYDGDGVDEAYVATANLYDGYLVAWDFGANQAEWTSAVNAGDGRAITAADLNGDGAPELVTVTAEGYVLVYDVKASSLLWKSTSIGAGTDVEVADLDGDGTPEIVALSTSRLYAFRRAASGPSAWLESASVPVSGLDLAAGDCDGDGAPELYVLGGYYSYAGTTVQRLDAALVSKGSFTVRGNAASISVEDLGTARKNLVLGKGDSYAYSGTPALLEAVDPATGAHIWESPPLWGMAGRNSLSYVDLDGDGFRELAFGTTSGMYLTR